MASRKPMAQTGLRYGRHWRGCGFSLWIKGVAEMPPKQDLLEICPLGCWESRPQTDAMTQDSL